MLAKETTLYYMSVSEIQDKQVFVNHLNDLEDFMEDKWAEEDLIKKYIVVKVRHIRRISETSIGTYRTNEEPESVRNSYKEVIIHNPNDIQSIKNLIKLEELLESNQ